jgi:hypothetical protein
VLFALPLASYKAVLNFNLKSFGLEKSFLEERLQVTVGKNEQNEVTSEIQKVVSKILNSKEFTTSLVSLFEILREAMPTDLYTELTPMQK